jgi:AhpD family alkylhydroperoxidase
MQHSAAAAQGLLAIENYLKSCSIPQGLQDLVKIRVSQLNNCAFCLDMHSKEAKIHGEKELRLYHVSVWRESPLFEKRERAALEWAELVTRLGEHGVSDEQFQTLKQYFNDQEISDLTVAIVAINAWNRFGVAFRPTPGGMDKMMGLDKAGL